MHITAAVVGLLACAASVGRAQKSRGFEWGGDAALLHYSYSLPGGQSSTLTSFTFPVSNVRVAFPTDGPFEPEISAGLTYTKTTGGRSVSDFDGDVALLMELSHDMQGPRWFVRPALGWQRTSVSSAGSESHATLGAGVGVRIGITDRIAGRYEARYTYLTAARGVSANIVGLLAGISIFTR
jgi:opacity protein-like surface antigen